MLLIKNKLKSPICLELKPVALYIAPGKTARISKEQKNDPAIISALGKNIITMEGTEKKPAKTIGNKKGLTQSKVKRKPRKNSKADK